MGRSQEVKDFLAAFTATSKMVEDRRWHDILEKYYNKKTGTDSASAFDLDAARKAANVGSVSTGSGGASGGGGGGGLGDNASPFYRELINRGVKPDVAAGAIASMTGESGKGLNTAAYNPDDNGGPSGGALQWHKERLTGPDGLIKFAGLNPNDPTNSKKIDAETQAKFMGHELDTKYKGVLDDLKSAGSAQDGVRIWTKQYEVPANADAQVAIRSKSIPAVQKWAQGLVEGPKQPSAGAKTDAAAKAAIPEGGPVKKGATPLDISKPLAFGTYPPGVKKADDGSFVGADGKPVGSEIEKDGVRYINKNGVWSQTTEPKTSADAGDVTAQKPQQFASATQNDATPTGEKSSYVPDITKGAIPTPEAPAAPVTPGSNPLADAGTAISKGVGDLGNALNPQSWKLASLVPDPSFGKTDTLDQADQTDKSDTTDQTPAIPPDDSSFSLFGAKGGLIQRVEHMEDGGTAGDDDEEDTSTTASPEKVAQNATGIAPPTPGAGGAAASAVPAGGAQPQASPDDPITALGNAIKGALSGIQDTLGLGGAVHPGADAHHAAAKTLEKGNGALDDKTYHATMNAVDKDGQLPGAIANAYALTKAYEYHMEHGDAAKAKAAATDLVFYLKQKAAYFGDQAVKETDPVKRAQLVNAALNQIPSTNETTATPATDGSGGGTFTVKDPKTGEIITQGPYTPQMLLAAAMKMKDGSGYYAQLLENSGQQPKRDPAAERAAALKQKEAADAAEEKRVADARRAFDTDGAPAAAAPAEGAPAAAPAAAPSAIPPAVTPPAPAPGAPVAGAPAPGPQVAAVPPVTPPAGSAVPTFAMNDQTAAAAPAPAAPAPAPFQAPTPAAAAGAGAIPTMAQNIQPAPSPAAPPAPSPAAAAPAAAASAPTAAADLPDLPGKPEAPTPEELAMSKRSADILKGMSPQRREQWNALDKDNQKDVQSRHILAVKEAKEKVDAFNTWQEKNDAAKQKALAGLKANPEGEYDPREDAAQKQNATDAYDSWEADQKADPAKAAELAKIPPVVKRQTLDLVTHALRANSSLTADEALDFAHNVIQPVSPLKPGDIKAMPHGGVVINMDGRTVELSKDGTATMMKLKKKLFDDYVAKQKSDAEAAEKEKLKAKGVGEISEGVSGIGSNIAGGSMAREAGETVSTIGGAIGGYWDLLKGFAKPKPDIVGAQEKGFALPSDAQSAYTGQEQEPPPGTKQPSRQATRFLGIPY